MSEKTLPASNQSNRRKRSLRDYLFIALFLLISIAVIISGFSRQAEMPNTALPIHDIWKSADGQTVDMNSPLKGDLLLTADFSSIAPNGRHLCMISIDTLFDIYADDQLIYSYRPVPPKLLGCSYGMTVHTAALPSEISELKLVAEPIFPDSAPAMLNNMVLEDAGAYVSGIYKANLPAFIRSTITILIGLLFLILGIPRGILTRFVGIDCISFGCMCMLLGFLGLNDTYILQSITQQSAVIRVMTYLCIMFVPYPALNFFACASGNKHSKTLPAMFFLCTANFAVTLLLTITGVSDYYYLVSVSHCIFVIDFLFAVFLIVRAVRQKTIAPQLVTSLIAGLSACILGAGIDVLHYYLKWSSGFSNSSRIGVMLFMILMSIYLFREQIRALNQKHQESVTFIKEITEAFAKVIDMKDSYTNGHSFRVANYTAMLAKELGCDADTTEKFYRIALLHDIGKIGIPSAVLQKRGKLTDEEYRIIQSHAELGYSVLKDISIMPELAVGAHSHHERMDGKGYPEGLKGDEIPRVAQIIAVADTFDAMYSNRPYRNRMNFEKAVAIIREAAGSQLSEEVVKAFLRLVERGEFRSVDDIGGGTTANIDNTQKCN